MWDACKRAYDENNGHDIQPWTVHLLTSRLHYRAVITRLWRTEKDITFREDAALPTVTLKRITEWYSLLTTQNFRFHYITSLWSIHLYLSDDCPIFLSSQRINSNTKYCQSCEICLGVGHAVWMTKRGKTKRTVMRMPSGKRHAEDRVRDARIITGPVWIWRKQAVRTNQSFNIVFSDNKLTENLLKRRGSRMHT
jgi:hypothetical protein